MSNKRDVTEQVADLFGTINFAGKKEDGNDPHPRIAELEQEKQQLAEKNRDLRNEIRAIEEAVYKGQMVNFGRCTMTPVGLEMPDDLRYNEWIEVGRLLFNIDGSLQWMIGDWLNFGDNHKWGETIRQIADEFGKEIATIYDYKYVSDNVKVSVRTETLSFTHHKLVAALPPSDQLRLIKLAAYGDPVIGKDGNPALNEDGTPKRKIWSVARLRKEIQGDQPKVLPSFDDKLVSFIDRWIKDSDPRTVVDKLREMADKIEAKL